MWQLNSFHCFKLSKLLFKKVKFNSYQDFASQTKQSNRKQITQLQKYSGQRIVEMAMYHGPIIGHLRHFKHISEDAVHQEYVVRLESDLLILVNLILQKFEFVFTFNIDELTERRAVHAEKVWAIEPGKFLRVADLVDCMKEIQDNVYHAFHWNCGKFTRHILGHIQAKEKKCANLIKFWNLSQDSALSRKINQIGIVYRFKDPGQSERLSFFEIRVKLLEATDNVAIRIKPQQGQEFYSIEETNFLERNESQIEKPLSESEWCPPISHSNKSIDLKLILDSLISVTGVKKTCGQIVSDFHKDLLKL